MAYLVVRWQYDMLQAVDNVLDTNYFNEFLPALIGRDLSIFYEVRCNLSRQQIGILKRAGVHDVQPGIHHISPQRPPFNLERVAPYGFVNPKFS